MRSRERGKEGRSRGASYGSFVQSSWRKVWCTYATVFRSFISTKYNVVRGAYIEGNHKYFFFFFVSCVVSCSREYVYLILTWWYTVFHFSWKDLRVCNLKSEFYSFNFCSFYMCIFFLLKCQASTSNLATIFFFRVNWILLIILYLGTLLLRNRRCDKEASNKNIGLNNCTWGSLAKFFFFLPSKGARASGQLTRWDKCTSIEINNNYVCVFCLLPTCISIFVMLHYSIAKWFIFDKIIYH